MLFSDRLRLASEFVDLAEKNGVLPLLSKENKKIVAKIACQVIAFLQIKGLIKEDHD